MKQVLLIITFVMALSSLAIADVPQMINYQGHLTDSEGNLIDTTVNILFYITRDSAGSIGVWLEEHSNVEVIEGKFCVKLGSMFSITEDVFVADSSWLGIAIGGISGGEHIEPPTELISVPFAFRISTVDGASGGTLTSSLKILSAEEDPGLEVLNEEDNTDAIWGISTGGSGYKTGGLFKAVQDGTVSIGLHAIAGNEVMGGNPASNSNIGLFALYLDGASPSIPNGNWAGYFHGDVKIRGDFEVTGTSHTFDFNQTYQIDEGEILTITHGLGGSADYYIIYVDGKSNNGNGWHQANFGTSPSSFIPAHYIGLEWYDLTNNQIKVTRGNDDNQNNAKDWDFVRIRIIENQ